MDFHRSIIGPMHKIIGSDWAKQNCIDTQKIGAAGFSAGGLIATLLGTVYQRELNFKIQAALNYYGPVDLRQWFAFHMVRAGEMQYDSFYDGLRGPDEIGHSANGAIKCRDLSQRVILKVAQNLGGMAPGRLHPFSHELFLNTNLFGYIFNDYINILFLFACSTTRHTISNNFHIYVVFFGFKIRCSRDLTYIPPVLVFE
jgi:hypothetical protein